MGESHGTGVGTGAFAAATGLFAGGAAGGAAAAFGGTADELEGGAPAGAFVSDWTEPDAVAFTPPGTAGFSAVGVSVFC